MYTPEHFREARPEVLRAFIARHPLGALIAHGPEGLCVELAPMQLSAHAEGEGRLRGHLARANPFWRTLAPGAPVLTLFRGAAHYVSPSWYPAKREHGRVVPTWNYVAVQVRGTIRFFEDARWLATLVEALTDEHEQPRAAPWRVADAPADYVAGMLRAIVGFEIEISAIEGKFKASQNRSDSDRAGVRAGLCEAGVSAADIAELCLDPL
ncbi:MAG TPA: FMN-binding negative transcriptional regulator [Steroidobacteraceae bacterium]|nr:FMN-binding negative transcriptional regulator [Steroidobacteraceae bacterium]